MKSRGIVREVLGIALVASVFGTIYIYDSVRRRLRGDKRKPAMFFWARGSRRA